MAAHSGRQPPPSLLHRHRRSAEKLPHHRGLQRLLAASPCSWYRLARSGSCVTHLSSTPRHQGNKVQNDFMGGLAKHCEGHQGLLGWLPRNGPQAAHCCYPVNDLCGIESWENQTETKTPEQLSLYRVSSIIPIFKSGKKNCVDNYRPISLYSALFLNYGKINRQIALLLTTNFQIFNLD